MHKEELFGTRIFTLSDFFSADECRSSIAFTEQLGYADAPVTTTQGFVMAKHVRNNDRVMVDQPALAARLFSRALPFLPPQVDAWHLHGMNERFRYYRYDVGQRFRKHDDGSFRRNPEEESQLTFMIYLNDDFTGGTTDFYDDNETLRISVRPRRGMALVFVHAQLHEGTEITSGRKYVLRTDVMYRVVPAVPKGED